MKLNDPKPLFIDNTGRTIILPRFIIYEYTGDVNSFRSEVIEAANKPVKKAEFLEKYGINSSDIIGTGDLKLTQEQAKILLPKIDTRSFDDKIAKPAYWCCANHNYRRNSLIFHEDIESAKNCLLSIANYDCAIVIKYEGE